jgi:ATPase family associated with various cellular activities (AAA)
MNANHHFILDESGWDVLKGRQLRSDTYKLQSLLSSPFHPLTTRIEVTKLRCYPGARLMRLRSDDETNGHVPYWLELKDGNLFRLNGSPQVVETLNELCPVKLNRHNVIDYLNFCGFFARSGSPCLILAPADGHLFGLSDEQVQILFQKAPIPAVIDTESSESYLTCAITFVRDNQIQAGHFRVTVANGDIETMNMVDETFCTVDKMPRLASAVLNESVVNTTECARMLETPLPKMPVASERRTNSRQTTTLPPLNRMEVERRDGLFQNTPKQTPTVQVLDHITPSDNEADEGMVKTYSQMLTPCPLQTVPVDLQSLAINLNQRYPWFRTITEFILKALVVSAHGDRVIRIPPLLLVGSPGTGKTSYASDLAQALAIPIQVINVGGKSDARDLLGTARGYASRQPNLIVRLMLKNAVANGLSLLDELDKCAVGKDNGSIVDALLTFLEPSSAKAVWDECLGGMANLSTWQWLATANSTAQIPSALLSRFAVIDVPSPSPEHYPAIIANTIAEFTRRNHINPQLIPVFDEADWHYLKKCQSPRKARKATELLLGHWLAHPKPGVWLN